MPGGYRIIYLASVGRNIVRSEKSIRGLLGQEEETKEDNTFTKEKMQSNPLAFISYAWESDEMKNWVKYLATQLRSEGIDAKIDQWEVIPGDQLPHFMEKSVRENDYVLIVCTPKYKNKSENRIGGVGYEGDIMTAEVLRTANHRKFIPVLKAGTQETAIPTWLQGKYFVDLSSEKHFNDNFEDLVTTLLNAREKAPALGVIRDKYIKVADSNKSENRIVEDADIKIKGILIDEVSQPLNDGTRGSVLYKIPFELNKVPDYEWTELFINAWDRPSTFTSMHRPGIASVNGNKIILDGTQIEEVEKYHKDTLKLAVDIANKGFKEIKERKDQKEEQERNQTKDNKDKLNNIIFFIPVIIIISMIYTYFTYDIRKENNKTTIKNNTDSSQIHKKTLEINANNIRTNKLDLQNIRFNIEKKIKENSLDISSRIVLWDSALIQARNSNINGSVIDENNEYDFGKTSIYRRNISDSYLASCKLLNQKSNYIINTNKFYNKKYENILVDFLNELGKESLDLSCFVKTNSTSNRCPHYNNNFKTDLKYKNIVNFRIRLGELIYQNLFFLENTSTYKIGDFSNILLPEERSADNIKDSWKYFKPILFKIIDRELFRKRDYNIVINNLILTHDYIYSKDYKSIFYLITNDKSKGKLFNENDNIPKLKSIEMNNVWGKHFSQWFYSFWYRRYIENTDSVTLEILKEIAFHYK